MSRANATKHKQLALHTGPDGAPVHERNRRPPVSGHARSATAGVRCDVGDRTERPALLRGGPLRGERLDADDVDEVALVTGVREDPVDHCLTVGAVGETDASAILVQHERVDADDYIGVVVQDRPA